MLDLARFGLSTDTFTVKPSPLVAVNPRAVRILSLADFQFYHEIPVV